MEDETIYLLRASSMDSNQWALRHSGRKRALKNSMCALPVGVAGLENTNWTLIPIGPWVQHYRGKFRTIIDSDFLGGWIVDMSIRVNV